MGQPGDDSGHGLEGLDAVVRRAHDVEERHEAHGWMEKTWSFTKGSAYAIVALNPITLPATLMLDPRFRRIELAAARSVTIAPGLMLDASINVGTSLLESVVPILRDLAKWAGGGALVGGAIGAVGGLGVLDEATIPGGLLAGFEAGLMIGGFWALKDLLMEAAKHLHTFINYSIDAAELAWYAGDDPTVSEEQDINAAAKLFAVAISELWWVILQALILWVLKRVAELGLKGAGAAIKGTALETALDEASVKSAKFGKPFTDWFKTNFREIQSAVESRARKLRQIQEGDASGGGQSNNSTPRPGSTSAPSRGEPPPPEPKPVPPEVKTSKSALKSGEIKAVDPNDVRASQKTVSYNKTDRITGEKYTYDDLVKSMKADGWKGDPVDAVEMPDGKLTSIDNTRIAAAREAGIDAQVRTHAFDDPLPSDMVDSGRFGDANTWGEAVSDRIQNQGTTFSSQNPYGSAQTPRITGRPK